MTHLFRRLLGLGRLASSKHSSDPTDSRRMFGLPYKQSNATSNSRSFERLYESHMDNVGLFTPTTTEVASTEADHHLEALPQYDLNQIKVINNIDVSYDKNSVQRLG
jgi:hypothetical protein